METGLQVRPPPTILYAETELMESYCAADSLIGWSRPVGPVLIQLSREDAMPLWNTAACGDAARKIC